jgi:hypothetical protein
MAPRLKQTDPGPVALRAEVEQLWQKFKGDLSQYPNPALIYNKSKIKGGFQIYGNKWENKAANQYRSYIKEKFLQNGMFQILIDNNGILSNFLVFCVIRSLRTSYARLQSKAKNQYHSEASEI